jgi:hypothetical protein
MPHGTLTIPTFHSRSGVDPASLGRWTDPLGRQQASRSGWSRAGYGRARAPPPPPLVRVTDLVP